jgi:hypothetical protein
MFFHQYISKHEDIDEAYSNFENSIIQALDKHAPIKRRKHIPHFVMGKIYQRLSCHN